MGPSSFYEVDYVVGLRQERDRAIELLRRALPANEAMSGPSYHRLVREMKQAIDKKS